MLLTFHKIQHIVVLSSVLCLTTKCLSLHPHAGRRHVSKSLLCQYLFTTFMHVLCRAAKSHIYTPMGPEASQHASRRSRFLNEHVVTKTEIGASRVPFQQQRRTPPHSTTGIVCGTTQQGALDNTESTRTRATVCRPTTASAHENLDKVSSDSRPTIQPYNDVTLPKRCEKFTGPRRSHLLTSSIKHYSQTIQP